MIHLCPNCAEPTPGEWNDELYWDCVNYHRDVSWAWCRRCQEIARLLGVAPRDAAKDLKLPGRGLVLNLIREIAEWRKCPECSAGFTAHQRNQKYCGDPCKQRASVKRTIQWRLKHLGPRRHTGRPRKSEAVEVGA